jgi:hypothetical protein
MCHVIVRYSPVAPSRSQRTGQPARRIERKGDNTSVWVSSSFNLLFGSQLTIRQTAALILTAINVTAALSLAFASITLTFWLTVPDYGFFVLLNVGVLALMSWWGLSFLIQGMRFVQQGYLGVRRRRMLLFWVLIYAFVGTQMAWALRPFVGAPWAPFELIRESEGTFYNGVYYLLLGLLGL